ncbi:hypothetical protein GQ42DRAFT_160564 [Ramicandelaber brevisporus]|nr:hypothetical protein GQ42DRAFT_160564 [Ramicandelaber brevisporus]
MPVVVDLASASSWGMAILDAVCIVTGLARHDDYMTRKLLKYGVPDAVLLAYPDLFNCNMDSWLHCITAHTLKLRQLPVLGYSELHAVELFLAQLKQWRGDRVFAVGEDEPTPLSDMDNERLDTALAPLYQILAVSPVVSVDARFEYSRRAIRGFNRAATSTNSTAEDKAASAKFLVDNLRLRQVLMPIQQQHQQHQDQPRQHPQQQQQQQQSQQQPEFQLESLPAEFQAFAHNARNHAREEAIRAGTEPLPHLDDPVYKQQVRRQVQARLQQHRPAHPPHPPHPAPAIPPRQHFQVQWEHDHHNHVETAAMEALAVATRYAVRAPHSDDAAHSLRRLMALFVQEGHHMQRNAFFLNGIRDIPLTAWLGNGIFSHLLHRVESLPRTLQLVVRDVGNQLITRCPHDVALPLLAASARSDTTPAARELLDALVAQLKSQHPQLLADHQRFLSSINSLAQPPVKTLLAFFTPRVLAVLRCSDPQHTSQQTTALVNAAADIYNHDPELFARYSHSASVNRAASFATSTASTREDSSDVTSTTSDSSEDSSSEIRQPAGLPPSPFERGYLYHFCDNELRTFIHVYNECTPVAHNEKYFRLRDVMRTLHAKLQCHADTPQDDIEHGIAAMNESLHDLIIRVPGTLPVTSSTSPLQVRNVTISSIRIGSALAHTVDNTRILRVHGSDNSVRAFNLCHHKHASRESLAQDFTRIINNISRLLNPVVATAIGPASLLPDGLFCQVAERIYGIVVRNRYEIWQMLAASTEVPQAEIDRLRRHLDELVLEQPLPEGYSSPHPQSFKDTLRQCIADAGY